MNKLLIILLSVALCYSTVLARSDHKEYKEHKGEKSAMLKKLGLEKEQVEKFKQIKEESHKKKYKLSLQIKQKNIELKQILIEDLDLAKIKTILLDRSKMTIEKDYLEYESDLEIKNLLNENQWNKYLRYKGKKQQKCQKDCCKDK